MKRKAKTGAEAAPEAPLAAKTVIPEALEDVWNADVAAAYKALRLEHQAFLLNYLVSGFNGAEAYRKAYSHTEADNNVAASCASRLLRNANIRAILDRFRDEGTEDFFLCVKVFRDAARASADPGGLIPDHDIRLKGGHALAKLRGFNAPEKVEDDRLAALLSHMNRSKEDSNAQEKREPAARLRGGRHGFPA